MRLFRDAGIRKEHVNDEVLATNIATLLESGCNNIMASPLFYSVWHLIHRQSLGFLSFVGLQERFELSRL